jgi:hypothetical protein
MEKLTQLTGRSFFFQFTAGFPTLFMHMVTQRKKCLGTPAPSKKH